MTLSTTALTLGSAYQPEHNTEWGIGRTPLHVERKMQLTSFWMYTNLSRTAVFVPHAQL